MQNKCHRKVMMAYIFAFRVNYRLNIDFETLKKKFSNYIIKVTDF